MGKTDQWFLDDHTVHQYLDSGPSMVMFDGLDEIFDTADRQRVMQEIAGFAQRYPRARIIVTSRPVGYKEQVLRDAAFAQFGIQDLDDEQIDTFIHGWFGLTFPQQPQQAEQRIERVLGSVRQSKPIRLLAGNPMLLTIMALLAREEELPRERAKFYEKAVEVLCHHWDANRNLELPEDHYLNADDKKTLLRRIAMRMQAGKGGLRGNIIAEDELEQAIQAYRTNEQWQTDKAEAKKAARRMIRQLHEQNYFLCLRGPHLYGFVHRTFLEYLTAAEYVRLFDKQPQQMTIEQLVELFDDHCGDEWREVLRLIYGEIDEQIVGRIVEHLALRTDLDKWIGSPPLSEFVLAVQCVNELRTSNRIADAGRNLMRQTIAMFVKSVLGAGGRLLLEELLPTCRELGDRWPGRDELNHVALSALNGVPPGNYSQDFWPQFVAYVSSRREFVVLLGTNSESEYCRTGALRALADKWPDETTRKLIAERAVEDDNYAPRSAALRALAEKWPDEAT